MVLVIKLVAIVSMVVSIAWFISDPGFEPALAFAGSISALVSTFVVEKRSIRSAQQHQSVSKSSMGIQAGGDVNIRDINDGKHVK
jgi:hypothetical protein